MGLSQRWARVAYARPHVLLVTVPGHGDVRRAAERWLDEQRWPWASSPADADILLECGPAGPELSRCVDVAWSAMPGPRARARALAPTAIDEPLLAARAELLDAAQQRRDAAARPAPRLSSADATSQHERAGTDTTDDPGMNTDEHGDMADDGDMGMGQHGGMEMGMGSMDMGGTEMAGGLVMAGRGEDRDGLRLEVLQLTLGPLLPGWPAGLQVDAVLSGDVLTAATSRQLDPADGTAAPVRTQALDALAALLAASGWEDGARRARRARDEDGDGPATTDLRRRLERARLLRWSLRRLPAPSGGDLAEHLDRLLAAAAGTVELPRTTHSELDAALVGLDVGTAALVVAAFGPVLAAAGARA
jgi:hypothetical protein